MIAAAAPSHGMVYLVIACGTVVLMLAIRWLGRFLSATHPDPESAPRPTASSGDSVPPGMLAAVIAAAVHSMLREPVRIVSITPQRPPSVEGLMLQWSLEGRRAIYSSHRFR